MDLEEGSLYLKVPNAGRDKNNRYINNRRNDKGKFLKQSQSPYARENKGKEKQSTNPAYKAKNYDENFQANKSKDPVQFTSKDKA